MKITIVPVRHCRNRWVATTFDKAQAYELLHARTGSRIKRIASLDEAKRQASILEPARRSRAACIGARWDEIRNEVAGRGGVIASSLTEEEYYNVHS